MFRGFAGISQSVCQRLAETAHHAFQGGVKKPPSPEGAGGASEDECPSASGASVQCPQEPVPS